MADNYRDLVESVLKRAKAKGATEGDAVVWEGDSFSVQVRLGSVEKLTKARAKKLGVRLFFGKRSAVTSTSDLSPSSLDCLVEAACALAQMTATDDFSGLPSPEACARAIPDLDLYDPSAQRLSFEEKTDLATKAEAAALQSDSRITNSEGGDFSDQTSLVVYANSHGFCGSYQTSSCSLSVSPIASENGMMQRDYWYAVKRKFHQLDTPEAVGKTAAVRTIRRLGARKVRTTEAPVVFDTETASSLLSHLFGAVSGHAVYRGTSFLIGQLGRRIASEAVTVHDDGTLPSALGSRPFDGEGLPTRKTTVIEKGMLKSFLLDTYSARKLSLTSTGNASRGVGDAPGVGPTNFFLVPGSFSPEEIIRSVTSGLYVTDLIGFGVNPVTGDYSRGASGLWIENGEITHPVEEITIAGNLKEMLMNIEMVGNDLELRGSIAAPTLKISRMTIAGQ